MPPRVFLSLLRPLPEARPRLSTRRFAEILEEAGARVGEVNLILTSAVSVVQYHVERYYARGATRSLPPTPLQKLRAAAGELRARARRETAV